MNITFKTLQKSTFKVNVNLDSTVLELKEQIESEQGSDFSAARTKLIHSGKVMENDKLVKDYKLTEKSFIVVMVTKEAVIDKKETEQKKVEIKPKVEEEMNAAKSLVETETAPVVDNDFNQSIVEPTSDLLTGDSYQRAIQDMVAMGFEESQVAAAMQASYNNPTRAIDFLLSGNIPTNQQDEESGNMSMDGLQEITSQPAFQQLRQMIRQNPEILPQVLQQIAEFNPEMMEIISANEEEFLELLNSGETGPVPQSSTNVTGQSQVTQGEQPGQLIVQLTPEDRDAIERLKALGFEEALVVQAYFACDKNEEAAANFLFEDM